MRALALTLLALCACEASHAVGTGTTIHDGGDDASSDAGADANLDAGLDASDGGLDGGADAGFDAGPPCTPPPYPSGPYGVATGAVLSERSWVGVAASGALATVTTRDLQACTGDGGVGVLRIGASWCGTCRSYAAHTKTLLASDVGASVRLMDVLLYDRDNEPSTVADALDWQALEDVVTPTAVDPALSVSDLLPATARLPLLIVVDAKTMVIRDVLSDPTEDDLEQSVRAALATQRGEPVPKAPAPMLYDGRFSRDQWDIISAMPLDTPPPDDPSNSIADSMYASAFGSDVFSDFRFSPSGTVACLSCHAPIREYTDGHPTPPDGVGRVNRNAPSLTLASYARWQFWDGRADSLWSQALGPIENANEFGSSRLFVAHVIQEDYQAEYEALFGPLPPLSDTTRFPPSGMPGDPAYDGMTAADQQAVTQIFVNVGKSIEAFERTLRGTQSSLDLYASGATSALTDDQKDGLLAFMRDGCAQCHWGPRLTDDAFHVLRFPSGSLEAGADPGRQAGIPEYATAEFGLGSVWSDDPSLERSTPAAGAGTFGAFKTPELRNVSLTAPYGHGGNYSSLNDVVELIRTGGLPAGNVLTEGTTDRWVVPFDMADDAPLATFLESLDTTH